MTVADPAIPGESTPRRADRRRRAGRRRRPVRRRLIRLVIAVLVVVPLLGLGYYGGLAALLGDDVTRVDVLRPDGPEIAAEDAAAETFLLVGTGSSPDGDADRSSAVLLHVPVDGARAVAVVLPSRGYVDVPACVGADGRTVEPSGGRLDAVLPDAGAGCLVAAVQQLTGLAVDHYVQFDVPRLADLVRAVGGVTVCLPTAVPQLGLAAGRQRLDGPATVDLLTAELSDATDPVEAAALRAVQEHLLGAVVARVGAASRVLHPVGTTRMLSAATQALTVDRDTGWGELQRLVRVVRGFGSDAVATVPLPLAQVGYRPADGGDPVDLVDAQAARELLASLTVGGPTLESAGATAAADC